MPANAPQTQRPDFNRQRHLRAFLYVVVGMGIAFAGRAFLGFDNAETLAYGVVTYATLVLLNYRSMLVRVPASAVEAPRDQRPR